MSGFLGILGHWLVCCCQLTRFPNGSSSLGFGDRDDQSTTKPRKVPITSKLRRINPTFSLISVGSGGVWLQRGYAITTARKGAKRGSEITDGRPHISY